MSNHLSHGSNFRSRYGNETSSKGFPYKYLSRQMEERWRRIRYEMRHFPGCEISEEEIREYKGGVRFGNVTNFKTELKNLRDSIDFHRWTAGNSGIYNSNTNEGTIQSLGSKKSQMSQEEWTEFEKLRDLHNQLKREYSK